MQAGDISQIQARLPDILAGASQVYTDLSPRSSSTSAFARLFSRAPDERTGLAKLLSDRKVQPLRPLMNDLRVFKSEAEIANMRKAGRASGRAFTNAMRQRFSREKDLAARLDFDFKTAGCDASAYVPVVAGGRNALSIHYVRNDDVLADGQLVLVDAGGEHGGYVSDITRTWPVGGRFTAAQRDLYEAVLRVQRTCVALCRQDAHVSLDKLHAVAENGLTEQLGSLGFDMTGNVSRDVDEQGFFPRRADAAQALETLFPHHVGHYVGLDVHDSPGYPRTGELRAGAVHHHRAVSAALQRHDALPAKIRPLTCSPSGVYVPDDERWPAHFRGLGVRTEDSVCVQDESPLVLTTEAVKEVRGVAGAVSGRAADSAARWSTLKRSERSSDSKRNTRELVYSGPSAS